jgi:hypothetical protein
LGPENVIEYPRKPSLHGGPAFAYKWYPCLFKWPEYYSDEQKIRLLRQNWFDAIIVGCNDSYDFTYGGIRPERVKKGREEFSQMYELAMQKSKTIPTYALDFGDGKGINDRIRKEFNCLKYFKREYLLKDFRNDPAVLPLSLCLADSYVPESIDYPRRNLPFFAGNNYGTRKPFIAYYETFGRYNTRGLTQGTLARKMLQYQIGIDLTGYGEDTIRHYEIPARGELLLCPKVNIIRKHDFVDGVSAVFYDGFNEFKKKLKYYMSHQDKADKIRFGGRKRFLKYHTSTARAKELLKQIND